MPQGIWAYLWHSSGIEEVTTGIATPWAVLCLAATLVLLGGQK